jgi:SAM-dependent methyltransferase
MTKPTIHTKEQMSGWYDSRRLDTDFPYLKPYLSEGIDVLDVGCGPGTVTLGVAEQIRPGRVTGVDREAKLLTRANEHKEAANATNATFVENDAYDLQFPDNSFDLTYTRDVLHFLSDPVCALREQRRVTRPDGTIIAFAIDWGTFTSYPELRAVKRVLPAWKEWATAAAGSLFVDQYVGSKLFSYFFGAGIKDVAVHGIVQPTYCVVHGTEAFERWYPRLKMHFRADGDGSAHYGFLFSRDILDQTDIDQALEEIDSWHSNPDAFMSVNYFLAVGKA